MDGASTNVYRKDEFRRILSAACVCMEDMPDGDYKAGFLGLIRHMLVLFPLNEPPYRGDGVWASDVGDLILGGYLFRMSAILAQEKGHMPINAEQRRIGLTAAAVALCASISVDWFKLLRSFDEYAPRQIRLRR